MQFSIQLSRPGWLLLALVLIGRSAQADEEHPLEPADTSGPRETLQSFIDACNETYGIIHSEGRAAARTNHRHVVRRMVRCLDLSQEVDFMRDYAAMEATVCLKEVLDRVDLPDFQDIPDAEAAREQELQQWRLPHTDIIIARVAEGPRAGEFLFSPQTVSQAAEFYELASHLPYRVDGPDVSKDLYNYFLSEPGSGAVASIVRRLPRWTDNRVFGQAWWQWAGLMLAIAVAVIAMLLAYRIGRVQSRKLRERSAFRQAVTLIWPAAALLVPLWLSHFAARDLSITGNTLIAVTLAANVVFLAAAVVFLIGAGNRIADAIIASPRINPQGLDAQFVRITCRTLSLVAAIVVFLEGGRWLGIPLTTLLAGAGVGGLTIALAAQDTLKNLFGCVMITLDKPYRVGERIVVQNYDGVVEEIGMRSTKIRLLTGHLTSIPNEQMAKCDIENIGRRPHIRRITSLRLALETPPEKAERAVEVVREILADHEGMDPEFPPRVYQNEINPDSLNIQMIYWYHPPNYWDFLAFSQAVNQQVLQQLQDEGIQLVAPTTATRLQTGDEALPLYGRNQPSSSHPAGAPLLPHEDSP